MTTSTSNNVPSLAQIMACVNQIEGQLEITVGNESTETANIGDSQTTIATQQLSDVEAYNSDAVKAGTFAIVAAVLGSVGSGLGVGCGMAVGSATGSSAGMQIASGVVSGVSQAGGASMDIVEAKFALDQGDLSAQQQLYTGASSTLGSVATSSQGVGADVIQGVTAITQDINGMLAQEKQASIYHG